MELKNYHEWIAERQQLLERIKELEAENAELRNDLAKMSFLSSRNQLLCKLSHFKRR